MVLIKPLRGLGSCTCSICTYSLKPCAEAANVVIEALHALVSGDLHDLMEEARGSKVTLHVLNTSPCGRYSGSSGFPLL